MQSQDPFRRNAFAISTVLGPPLSTFSPRRPRWWCIMNNSYKLRSLQTFPPCRRSAATQTCNSGSQTGQNWRELHRWSDAMFLALFKDLLTVFRLKFFEFAQSKFNILSTYLLQVVILLFSLNILSTSPPGSPQTNWIRGLLPLIYPSPSKHVLSDSPRSHLTSLIDVLSCKCSLLFLSFILFKN